MSSRSVYGNRYLRGIGMAGGGFIDGFVIRVVGRKRGRNVGGNRCLSRIGMVGMGVFMGRLGEDTRLSK